jgi:hypothetical protein
MIVYRSARSRFATDSLSTDSSPKPEDAVTREEACITMNLLRLSAVKAVLLTAVLGVAAMGAAPAQAGGRHGGHYGGGRDYGYVAGWHAGRNHGGRRFHREYGYYAPGHYYHDIGADGYIPRHIAGRRWCPERQAYVIVYRNEVDRYAYDDHGSWRDSYYDRDWRRDW